MWSMWLVCYIIKSYDDFDEKKKLTEICGAFMREVEMAVSRMNHSFESNILLYCWSI